MEKPGFIDLRIPAAFGLSPETMPKPLAGGHINDTFLIRDKQGAGYVIQKINRHVFPSPERVMENMVAVTSFLRKKILQAGGDPDRETLTVRKTLNGENLFQDGQGDFWRCTLFIGHAFSPETPGDPQLLREAGRAFGRFQSMLSDYPAETLHEILPDFHNTPARVSQLKQAVSEDRAGRARTVSRELNFAMSQAKNRSLLAELLRDGKLPLRVTHNDTKMSNVLFDEETGKAVCVIDLDTVMPGLAAFDFGDSIRAGASTAAEDERELSKVQFDMALYEAYTQGFLSAVGNALSPLEIQTLPEGAVTMTYETGIRFLADYLNGDVYFHTAYPTHNLDRARNQFKLVEDMEKNRSGMETALQKYL